MVNYWKLYNRYGLIILILLFGAFLAIVNPRFLLPYTLVNILAQSSYAAIGGAGMTLAIAGGGFDLSVGSILTLSACVVATLVPTHGILLAILAALLVGILLGVGNGIIITKLDVTPFIATLATLNIIRGIVYIYTAGRAPILIRDERLNVLTAGRIGPIPVPVIVMIVVFIIFYLVLEHTRYGRHLCGIGSNEEAAKVTGINVDRSKIIVFAITGLTAAMVGVMRAGQLMMADSDTGFGYELTAITVALVGGTSLSGGSGNMVGTFLAAIFVTMINYGLNLIGAGVFVRQLTLGALLIIAVFAKSYGGKILAVNE